MTLPRIQAEAHYRRILDLPDADRVPVMRELCRRDLYFLLSVVCGRVDMRRDWIYARCREVEAAPDGRLDLWARGHYKSTIGTFGLGIQDILCDPEVTRGILSHTRPIAKAFLRQIKRELESNILLLELFPDILWVEPSREAPSWSEESGLIVRRRGNPKEATVEAYGLVEGQPTGRHWQIVDYDDVVTRESVTTPEMIAKTTEAWELSLNLVAEGGRRRYRGTRYHYDDTHRTIVDRGAAIPRVHPAVDEAGEPVLLSREEMEEKRRTMGVATFSAQMLLAPKADSTTGFRRESLRWHDGIEAPGAALNRYIIVDPAHSKRSGSDWTSIWVIGAGSDRNFHACDIVRDRLSLTERLDAVFELHRKWQPLRVGYERYGLQADVEALKDRQRRENYRFEVVELGGPLAKPDRIARLLPVVEEGRLWLPRFVHRTIYDGTTIDLVSYFLHHEYLVYPAARYDDMLDALSRICDPDLGIVWPKPQAGRDGYRERSRPASERGWMAA